METTKSSHRGRNVVIALLIVVVVVAAGIFVAIPRGQNCDCTYTLVSSGQTYAVPPGQSTYSAFGLPPSTIQGKNISYKVTFSFTANATIAAYFMNSTSFTTTVLGTSYLYSSGNATSGTIDLTGVPPTNYYLVFYNTGLDNVTVTVTQPFIATGSLSG